MSDKKFRRLRVLHLVGADGKSAANPMLVPLLARGNRQRIEAQVVSFVPGDPRFAVVRQSGLPVHEVPLSRKRFSPLAILEVKKIVDEFKPDLLHAWGSTAQIAAAFVSGRGKKPKPIVWSISRTSPRAKSDGVVDGLKLKFNVKLARRCKRIVYPSAAASANYRRAGLPEDQTFVIAPGIDVERFKPDAEVRARIRQQLELPKDAVLVGMYAPFQPEYDHATFLKAVGELVRLNPNLYCVLAGRGLVKGNAALSAMIGGGALATRTRLVGEWTDLSALFNACDVVCSSATTDSARLTLAMAMLCGVLCAATGMGAQGEVVGSFGAAVEPGSVDAMVRGIRRILEMPPDRRGFMEQAARKHALTHFHMSRSIGRYQELYIETLTGKESQTTELSARDLELAAIMPIPKGAVTTVTQVPGEAPAEKGAAPVLGTDVERIAEVAAPPKQPAVEDSALAFDALALAAAPVKSERKEESVQDDVVDWSNSDLELIGSVITEAAPGSEAAEELKSVNAKAENAASLTATRRAAETTPAPVVEKKPVRNALAEARAKEMQRMMASAAAKVQSAPKSSASNAETKSPAVNSPAVDAASSEAKVAAKS